MVKGPFGGSYTHQVVKLGRLRAEREARIEIGGALANGRALWKTILRRAWVLDLEQEFRPAPRTYSRTSKRPRIVFSLRIISSG